MGRVMESIVACLSYESLSLRIAYSIVVPEVEGSSLDSCDTTLTSFCTFIDTKRFRHIFLPLALTKPNCFDRVLQKDRDICLRALLNSVNFQALTFH